MGHVARAATLVEAGVTARQLTAAVRSGRVLRVRRGTYACTHLDADDLRAVSLGGAVTCVSLLRQFGVWAAHSRDLHVQVPPNLPVPTARGIHLHREHPKFLSDGYVVSRMQALWRATRCLDGENALAAMESAIHEEFLTIEQVRRISRLAPRRLEPLVRQLDTNSQSGVETIVRTRLIAAGHRVVPQAPVPGMGHGDLLVDDCVNIETDGRAWHGEDRFTADRDRDLLAEGLGRRVIRLHSGHVFREWESTLAVIERVVADARRDLNRRRVGSL